MDDSQFEIGKDAASDEYIAAIYQFYLESTPGLLDDLDRTLYHGDPAPFKRILSAIATSSKIVSAKRVAQSADQMIVTLERLPFISRTFLGVELGRLRMEFHASKSEIELILESIKKV